MSVTKEDMEKLRKETAERHARFEEFLRRPIVSDHSSDKDSLEQKADQKQMERNMQEQEFRNQYPRPSAF